MMRYILLAFGRLLVLTFIFSAIAFRSNGQKGREINLASLSYLYNAPAMMAPGDQLTTARVIFALEDSMAREMAGSITRAINQRWGCNLSASGMQVEKVGGFLGTVPKFKPNTKKLEQDKLHVFMRVVDTKSMLSFDYLAGAAAGNNNFDQPTVLLMDCKVIDGSSRQETFSRSMQFVLQKDQVLPGQYALNRVPALPKFFLQAFDSAVQHFFAAADPGTFQLNVGPVCLLVPDSMARKVRQKLRFENEYRSIRQIDGAGMAWSIGETESEKIGRVRKAGENLLGGALTMFTGIGTEKVSVTKYLAKMEMQTQNDNQRYRFNIPYLEEEREQIERTKNKSSSGTSYSTGATGNSRTFRYIDMNSGASLTLGNDTIGKFQLRYGRSASYSDVYPYCWDGKDSSTIVPMPVSWSNAGTFVPLFVTGTLYGKPFVVQNSKDGNQMDLYYDSLHIATLRVIGDRPRDGMLYFADVDQKVLRALAMFTCLPYSNFRVN